MGIEDRLRDGLRRSAGEAGGDGPAPERLWAGIERGVLRAQRRHRAARMATVAFSLAVVVAAAAWLAVAFTGPRREPAASRPTLTLQDVRVFGVANGQAKIYGAVSNHGRRAVGAAIRCAVLDSSGHRLGTAEGAVPYLAGGGSGSFGPLGGQYDGRPSSAHCAAAAIPAVTPTSSPAATQTFQPRFVTFWDASHGLVAGEVGEPSCDQSCFGSIELTGDGGRTWSPVYRGDFVYNVTALDGRHAWALAGACAMGTCQIHVLFSADGGQTWTRRSTGDLKDVSFATADQGWGVGNLFPVGSQNLESTSDGGRTWRAHPVPCPPGAGVATGVSFVSPTHGWLLCTGEAGAGNQARAILATTDGGITWSTVAQAGPGGPASGGLSMSGYPAGLFFADEAHGWMWSDRHVGIHVTTDGGRSWRVEGRAPNGADTSMGSAWFLSGGTGFAVLANGNEQATQLILTQDGGRTWRLVYSWQS